jgi:hypothetical protein
MMRTIEVIIVIVIITGAFMVASYYAVLPWPRQVSPVNLRQLSFTTLQMLDSNHDLSRVAFETENNNALGELQIALSASLPANVIYNLTIYEISGVTTQLYSPVASIANAESIGTTSDASTYAVASSNVTFNVIPEKIGENIGGITLYILNCSDANGWWATGYTAQSLATDLYKMLSPYFVNTIMVQSTAELGDILSGNTLRDETIHNAVVINTFGEAVPIPTAYCTTPYSDGSYANYIHFLGERVHLYNWTWASIVGYPFYYVTNTASFSAPNDQNTWGIYGMKIVGRSGATAFLQGLDNQQYVYDNGGIAREVGVVSLAQNVLSLRNYYGIYPYPSQTSTRALVDAIQNKYHLTTGLKIFDSVSLNGATYNPGAVYKHDSNSGSLLALGMTRTPDIRLTALGILAYYQPRLFNAEYTAEGTSRLVVLQLGLVGGN